MYHKLKKYLPQFFSVLTVRQKRLVLPLILSLFLGSVLETIGVGLVLPIITLILEPTLLQKYIANYSFLSHIDTTLIEKYSVIVVLSLLAFIYIIKGMYLYLIAGFQTFFAFDCQSSISSKIFNYYINQEVLSADEVNSSVKIRNIIGEVSTLTSNFILPMLTFVSELFVLIGIAILVLLRSVRGQAFMAECREEVFEMLNVIKRVDYAWNAYQFSEGRVIVGVNEALMNSWSDYNAQFIYRDLGFDVPVLPSPLKYMDNWIDIDKIQNAQQEESGNNYALNSVVDDLADDEILEF